MDPNWVHLGGMVTTYKPKQMEDGWAPLPPESKGKRKRVDRRGTRTKLTPETQERVIQALKTGAYRTTAANYAGIGRTTMEEWCAKGREGREPFKSFFDAVEKAEAEFIIASVSTIRLQSRTQWQAAA